MTATTLPVPAINTHKPMLTSMFEFGDESSQPEGAAVSVSTVSKELGPIPASVYVLRDRSAAGLRQAYQARWASDRYIAAHLAALRAAAAVLAVRGCRGQAKPRSVWELVSRAYPDLAQWCAFFAATASRRAALETGRGHGVSAREADDLVRDTEAFLCTVEKMLQLPTTYQAPQRLPVCS